MEAFDSELSERNESACNTDVRLWSEVESPKGTARFESVETPLPVLQIESSAKTESQFFCSGTDNTRSQFAVGDRSAGAPTENVASAKSVVDIVSKVLLAHRDIYEKLVDLGADTVSRANAEAASGKIGPATRTVYNTVAQSLAKKSLELASELETFNRELPAGAPLDCAGAGTSAEVIRAAVRNKLIRPCVDLLEDQASAPTAEMLTRLESASRWCVAAERRLREAELRLTCTAGDKMAESLVASAPLHRWISRKDMSLEALAELESSRREWLETATSVKRYAETIERLHRLTLQKDQSYMRYLTMSNVVGLYPRDEALFGSDFPGLAIKDAEGKLLNVQLDLPATLDRTPENIAKMRRLTDWLDKYAPAIDRVMTELVQASISRERVLTYADEERLEDEPASADGEYNFTRKRFDAREVVIGQKTMIRVTTSEQKMHAGALSYLKQVGYVRNVGSEVSTGTIKIGGQAVRPEQLGQRLSVGTRGLIQLDGAGIEPEHCAVVASAEGRIFIRPAQNANVFVGDKKLTYGELVEVIDPSRDRVIVGGTELARLGDIRTQLAESDKEFAFGAEGTKGEHRPCLIKMQPDGRVLIKAASGQTVFLNGQKLSTEKFVELKESDHVIIGGAQLSLSADFRLYEKDAWVPVLLDQTVHIVQAKHLPAFASECRNWYGTEHAAVAVMDVGMLVSGGLSIKLATKQAAALMVKNGMAKSVSSVTTREAFRQAVRTAPFSSLHTGFGIGLGATGLAHQSIENMGPTGRKFLEYRGYAMMADIAYGSVFKDISVFFRKSGGGSLLRRLTPGEEAVKEFSELTTGLCNFYFIADIAARQIPVLASIWNGSAPPDVLIDAMVPPMHERNSNRLYLQDRRDDLLRATRGEDHDAVRAVLSDVDCHMAAKASGADVTDAVNNLARKFLCSDGTEKAAAAIGLLQLCQSETGETPAVLASVFGTRLKRKNTESESVDKPNRVTREDVEAALSAELPIRSQLLDRSALILSEGFAGKAEQIRRGAASDSERKTFINLWAMTFSRIPEQKVAAAEALARVFEHEGRLPEKIALIPGRGVWITGDEIVQCLSAARLRRSVATLDSISGLLEKGDREQMIERTKAALQALHGARTDEEKSDASYDMKCNMNSLAVMLGKTESTRVKCCIYMAMILSATDLDTGMLRSRLVGSVHSSNTQTVSQAVEFLRRNVTSLPPSARLDVMEVLSKSGVSPLGGASILNDCNSILLSVLQDKNSTSEVIVRAIAGHGCPGLIHTAARLPDLKTESIPTERQMTSRGDLTGRDSRAVGDALLGIARGVGLDSNARGLAIAVYTALSVESADDRCAKLFQCANKPPTLESLAAQCERWIESQSTLSGAVRPDADVVVMMLTHLRILRELPDADEKFPGLTQQSGITPLLLQCCDPNDARSFAVALPQLIPMFDKLSNEDRHSLVVRMTDFIVRSSSSDSASEHSSRIAVLSQLCALAARNPEILTYPVQDLVSQSVPVKTVLCRLLTQSNNRAVAEIKESIAVLLSRSRSSDDVTRAALTQSLAGDPSATVRNAAFDALQRLSDPFLLDIVKQLREKETDSTLIRKMQSFAERCALPEVSAEELQARSLRNQARLRDAARTSLSGIEAVVERSYPMLTGAGMKDRNVEKFALEYGGIGGWLRWAASSAADVDNQGRQTRMRTAEEMFAQLERVVKKAIQPDGDEAIRVLSWLLCSNGVSIPEQYRAKALTAAAKGLERACVSGNGNTRSLAAQHVTMCIALQPSLPAEATSQLISCLGTYCEGNPDTSVAVVSALRSHFDRMPRSIAEPLYADSVRLQGRLLELLKRNLSAEAIPLLEAMSEERAHWMLDRTLAGLVSRTRSVDGSVREFTYDDKGKVCSIVYEAKGERQTWLKGENSVWYSDSGKEVFAQVDVDQQSGRLSKWYADGTFEFVDVCGTILTGQGQQIERVSYADGSIRSLQCDADKCVRYIYTAADGTCDSWKGSSTDASVWYRSDGTGNLDYWHGSFSFKYPTGEFCIQRTEWTKPDDQRRTPQIDNFASLSEFRKSNIERWVRDLDFRGEPSRAVVVQTDSRIGERFASNLSIGVDHPSPLDLSAHPVAALRQNARALLLEVKTGTEWLRLQVESEVAPPRAKHELKLEWAKQLSQMQLALAARPGVVNAEEVLRTIFRSASVLPIEDQDDERREVLRSLCSINNERVKFAAAHHLYRSHLKDDQEFAVTVLARIKANGTALEREVQSLLTESHCPTKLSLEERDRLVAASRERLTVVHPNADRSRFEPSPDYHSVKAALLRNCRSMLQSLESRQWWLTNKYELLHEAVFVEVSGRPLASSPRVEALKEAQDAQFNRLLSESGKMGEFGREARIALAYILLHNGAPLPVERRHQYCIRAAETLLKSVKDGGPHSSDVVQWLKSALMTNSILPASQKMAIASCIAESAMVDKPEGTSNTVRGVLPSEAALVLRTALENELYQLRDTQADSQYCVHVIQLLGRLKDSVSLPALKGAASMNSEKLSSAARLAIARIEDRAISSMVSEIVPDRSLAPTELATRIRQILSQDGCSERARIMELFRLSARREDLNEGETDPRLVALRQAFDSGSPRVRLAGAMCMLQIEPSDRTALKVLFELSATEGPVMSEAGMVVEQAIKNATESVVQASFVDSCITTGLAPADQSSKYLAAILPTGAATIVNLESGRTALLCRTTSGIVLEEYRDGRLSRSHCPVTGEKIAELVRIVNRKDERDSVVLAASQIILREQAVKSDHRALVIARLVELSRGSADERTRLAAAKILVSSLRDLPDEQRAVARGGAELSLLSENAESSRVRQEGRTFLQAHPLRDLKLLQAVLNEFKSDSAGSTPYPGSSDGRSRHLVQMVLDRLDSMSPSENERYLIWQIYCAASNSAISDRAPQMQALRRWIVSDIESLGAQSFNEEFLAKAKWIVDGPDKQMAVSVAQVLLNLSRESGVSLPNALWRSIGSLCGCNDSSVRAQVGLLLRKQLEQGTGSFFAAMEGAVQAAEQAAHAKDLQAASSAADFAFSMLPHGNAFAKRAQQVRLGLGLGTDFGAELCAKLARELAAGTQESTAGVLVEVAPKLVPSGDSDSLSLAVARLHYAKLSDSYRQESGSLRHFSKDQQVRQLRMACNTFENLCSHQHYVEAVLLLQQYLKDQDAHLLLSDALSVVDKNSDSVSTSAQGALLKLLHHNCLRSAVGRTDATSTRPAELLKSAEQYREKLLALFDSPFSNAQQQTLLLTPALQVLCAGASQWNHQNVQNLASVLKRVDDCDLQVLSPSDAKELLHSIWTAGVSVERTSTDVSEQALDCFFRLADKLPAGTVENLSGLRRSYAAKLRMRASAIEGEGEESMQRRTRLNRKAALYEVLAVQ